ncbi:MAG: hypothetical protein KKE57_02995 [Proteobacteria bacterium]|nr:hypothetical protein [Pseudomonadota bacterium]
MAKARLFLDLNDQACLICGEGPKKESLPYWPWGWCLLAQYQAVKTAVGEAMNHEL